MIFLTNNSGSMAPFQSGLYTTNSENNTKHAKQDATYFLCVYVLQNYINSYYTLDVLCNLILSDVLTIFRIRW